MFSLMRMRLTLRFPQPVIVANRTGRTATLLTGLPSGLRFARGGRPSGAVGLHHAPPLFSLLKRLTTPISVFPGVAIFFPFGLLQIHPPPTRFRLAATPLAFALCHRLRPPVGSGFCARHSRERGGWQVFFKSIVESTYYKKAKDGLMINLEDMILFHNRE